MAKTGKVIRVDPRERRRKAGVEDGAVTRRDEPRPQHDEQAESQPGVEEVYFEVQGETMITWPARKDMTDSALVAETAALLWKRSQAAPDDTLCAGAARVLYFISAMLEDRSQRAMNALERIALDHDPGDLSRRRRPDSPSAALPPRANVDRHRNLAYLVAWVRVLRRGVTVKGQSPSMALAAVIAVDIFAALFPQHAVRYRRGGSPKGDAADRVLAAWEKRAEREEAAISEIDEETLTLDVLVVHGIPAGTGHNWMKGIEKYRDQLIEWPPKNVPGARRNLFLGALEKVWFGQNGQ